MADRLIRVHAEDFEYLKDIYPATYFVRIDNVLFVSIEDEEEKFRNRPRLIIDHIDKMPVIIKRNGKIIYEE
jgi:hypothetical protein